MRRVVTGKNFVVTKSIEPEVQKILSQVDEDEAFWTGDFSNVQYSLDQWRENLPDIMMHYAVKCCNEPKLLEYLAKSGIGFDCASYNEINTMLNHGVSPKNIVFSHPLKSIAAINYAKEVGVEYLVFDTAEELNKILKHYPNAKVYLRLKPKFTRAQIQLSNKFGAPPEVVPELLEEVRKKSAHFVGFAFHVGSLCDDPDTFKAALQYVSDLIAKCQSMNLKVNFIDIGGGFLSPHAPAQNSFQTIAESIKDAIRQYITIPDVKIIAEPGRYIASEYLDLHLPVIGTKDLTDDNDHEEQMVYIPDGIYGAFNSIVYDHAEPFFEMMTKACPDDLVDTTLWGQTCDSADVVYDEVKWPHLNTGDLLTVRKFGAYTYSPASFFNGFNHHRVFYINSPN